MQCVDAKWELRNLGVRTIEIAVDNEDKTLSADELLNIVDKYRLQYSAEYVVIKSDTRQPFVSFVLQNAGYWLIENLVKLYFNRKDISKVLNDYSNIFEDVSYRLADDNDMQLVFDELKRGIFKTDRVAVDPHFNIELANRRYSFWIKDAVNNGSKLFISLYENNPIGFFLRKDNESKVSDGLLAGIFSRPETHHYGAMSFYAGNLAFIDSDNRASRGSVSTNNLDSLRLNIAMGGRITEIQNVFVKHFNYTSEVNRGGC